jgi:hypothetical protein
VANSVDLVEKVDFDPKYYWNFQGVYNTSHETRDIYKKEYYANLAVFKNPVVASRVTNAFFRRNKHNNVISLESCNGENNRVCQSNGLHPDHSFVSEYCEEVPSDVFLSDILFEKLYEFSQRSINEKMAVAWFLYNNDYVENLTPEQVEYWETDFEILDTIYNETDKKVNRIDLINHLGLTYFLFEKIQKALQRHLSGCRSAYS